MKWSRDNPTKRKISNKCLTKQAKTLLGIYNHRKFTECINLRKNNICLLIGIVTNYNKLDGLNLNKLRIEKESECSFFGEQDINNNTHYLFSNYAALLISCTF